MSKLLNRIQIAMALGTSAVAGALCVATLVTLSPLTSCLAVVVGVSAAVQWSMCD